MAAIIRQRARADLQQRRADTSAAPAGMHARQRQRMRQHQRRHDAQQRARLMARPSLSLPRLSLQP